MMNDEAQLERMRKAVKAFRKMQPSLTAYARAITGNPKVRVVLSSSSAMTDGTNIYFRPPLALGDEVAHDKRNCDKRDPNTYLQLCKACAVREEVYVNIYHEIGHIAFESFASASEYAKDAALTEAAHEMGDKYAEALAKKFKGDIPNTYLALSNFINPYFNGLFNAIEDARVDGKMFQARKGVRVMLQASTILIFREGIDPYDDKGDDAQKWADAPLNAQVALACICRIDGYRGWEPYLNPDVVRHTGMPNVQAVLDKLTEAKTVEDTFRLALPLMEALREYGYFKKPDEIPDPPPPPSPPPSGSGDESDDDEGSDDSSEGESEGDSSQASGEQQGEGSGSDVPDSDASEQPADDGAKDQDDSSSGGKAGDSGSSSSDQADDDESSGEEGSSSDGTSNDEGSDEVDDPSDGDSGGADSDPNSDESDADGSGGGDQQEEAEGSESDGDSVGDSDQSGSEDAGESDPGGTGDGGSDVAPDEGDSSSGDLESGSEGSDSGESGDDPGSDDASGGSSAGGAGEAESGEQAGDDDTDSSDGSDSDGEAGDESDGTDREEGGATEDATSSDEDGADEPGLPSDDQSDEGGPGSGELEESTPPPPDHKHGVDGQPCECGHCQTFGQPSDLDQLVGQLHAKLAKKQDSQDEADPFGNADIDEDFDTFIDQSEYMDTPSALIEKVMIHEQSNYNSRHFFRSDPDESIIPESVVGGALLHARKTFADNMRAAQETNLRRGRVRTSTLGRRAWQNDSRLFQRSRQPGRRDYSVLIGLDLSTSSLGEAHEMIRKAAMAQAEICHRLGLRFAVYGHSGNRYSETTGRYGERKQYQALDIIVIKTFDSPWSDEAKSRMMSVQPHGANLDGHTLEFYRKRLDEETTTDKILMYYTDGHMPYANKEEELEVLTREIKTCQRKGYTLMGVEVGASALCPPELDTCGLVDESDIKAVVKHLAKRLEQR